MTGALSPSHWLILLVVVLLVFGAKRLPDAARGLGKSMRILKAETTALSAEGKDAGDDAAAGSAATTPATPANTAATPVRETNAAA